MCEWNCNAHRGSSFIPTKLFYSLLVESDKGSTDSEVRKILTLHIPITEYDTLGSESDHSTQRAAAAAVDGSVQPQPANQSQKYRSQRGISPDMHYSREGPSPVLANNIYNHHVMIWEICLLRVPFLSRNSIVHIITRPIVT